MIKTNHLIIPKSSTVHPSATVTCDHFEIGENCYIGPNTKITCKKFVAGDYLYIPGNVEIGRGGCNGPNSEIYIGNYVGIFEGTVINPSEKITIGDNVGIGADVLIWTHGSWLNVLEGFPAEFGPVSIGNNVWLPARSIVLPNVCIGDDCVIGTGSIINKDIPVGSFAAGIPCKVIKKNCYPVIMSLQQKHKIISEIVNEWVTDIAPHKGITAKVQVSESNKILLIRNNTVTTFDTETRKMFGVDDEIAEDLRDFLRRKGIKIYTGKPFKSMKPLYEITLS